MPIPTRAPLRFTRPTIREVTWSAVYPLLLKYFCPYRKERLGQGSSRPQLHTAGLALPDPRGLRAGDPKGPPVLRDDQVDVATHFADTSGEYHDKLQGVPYGLTPGGSPFLLDCLAYLDCKVIDRARAGDHTVVVGEVTASDTLDESYPLIYDPGEYEEALR